MTNCDRRLGLLALTTVLALAFCLAQLPMAADLIDQVQVSDISPEEQHIFAADPAINTGPNLVNADDSSFIYARARTYIITVNVSDMDFAANIDYVSLSLWHDTVHVTPYWTIRFDEGTKVFSITSGSEYINIITDQCDYSYALYVLNLEFAISVDWDHVDLLDTDTFVRVEDEQGNFDTSWYETNWDIETDLDYYIGPSVTSDDGGTDDRGDLNEGFTISGTIEYHNSPSHLGPTLAAVDVWISASEYGVNIGPWAELINFTTSSFSINCYADNEVGLDTYTIKIVEEGVGSGAADLYYSTSPTVNYISDRVIVRGYTSDDDRININTVAANHVSLAYESDDSDVTTGTVTVNGVSATYSGSSGVWNFGVTRATAQLVTYDTVTISGDTHGVAVVNQDSQTLDQIWDQIVVVSYSASDERTNVGNSAFVYVTLQYDYLDVDLTDGTVTVNGQSTSYQGAGVWRLSEGESSVTSNTYDTVVCSGNTHGITTVNQNSQSQTVIWDQIVVVSYSIVGGDHRVNINDNVQIDVTLNYDFDDSDVTDGTVTINGETAVYQSAGVWRITVSEELVHQRIFDDVVCSGNTHGITGVSQIGQSISVIWDRLIIDIQADTESPENDQVVTFTLSATFEYDSTPCTTYYLVVHRDSNWFNSFTDGNKTSFQDDGVDVSHAYTVYQILSESSFGITAFASNTELVEWSTSGTITTTTTSTTTTTTTTTSTTTTSTTTTTTMSLLPSEITPLLLLLSGLGGVILIVLILVLRRRS